MTHDSSALNQPSGNSFLRRALACSSQSTSKQELEESTVPGAPQRMQTLLVALLALMTSAEI